MEIQGMHQVETASTVAALPDVVRREARYKMALPIRVLQCASPEDGFMNSVTYDVSRGGMRIHAVRGASLGDEVIVERKGRRACYVTVWVGREAGKSLIGLQAKSSDTVWDAEVLRMLGSDGAPVASPSDVTETSHPRPKGLARVLDWFGHDRRTSNRSLKSGVTVTYGITPQDQSVAHVIEVTDKGLSFHSTAKFAPGQLLRIFVSMPRAQYAHIALRAEVRHCSGGIVGVQFLDVTSDKRKLILERLVR